MRLWSFALVFAALPAAAYDAFADRLTPTHFVIEGDQGLRLLLKSATRLRLNDLEGEGGLGKDSATDTATLGTRSPHATLDGLDLALRLETEAGLGFRAALTFTDRVRPTGAVLDYRAQVADIDLHVEAGLNYPIVARFYQTAREPLTSRVYWGGQELHVAAEAHRSHGRAAWWAGASAALMRPLGARLINDASPRGTVRVLSYADAAPFSGVSPVVGGRLGGALGPVSLEAFGFVGRLSAEGGVDELRNRMPGFALLPAFKDGDPRDQDPSFAWGGGRLVLDHAGFEAAIEGIASRESLLTRGLLSAELGYALPWLELRARLEHYRLFEGPRPVTQTRALRAVDPSQAVTWDWDTLTLALASDVYLDVMRVQLEHTVILERNGAPALGIADVPLRNDETLLQLLLRF
jgi:hypothetical protein